MNNNLVGNINAIFGLNLLRFGAVLMVVFGHLMLYSPSNSIVTSQLAPLFGFLGVEALLVLCGFLIGKEVYEIVVLDDLFTLRSILNYVKTSAWHFLPVYFLVSILLLLLTLFFHYSTVDTWKYFVFLQNFSSPMPAFFPESWVVPVVIFGFITLVFGLFILTKKWKTRYKSNLFLGFAILMVMVFIGCKYFHFVQAENLTIQTWDQHLKSVVIYRLDSFYIGVCGAWLYFKCFSFWVFYGKFLALLGTLLLLLLFVGVGYFQWLVDSKPLFWSVFYLPTTSLSIALFLPFLSCWDLQKTVMRRFSTFMNKISYSLFLIHYSLLLQVLVYFYPLALVPVGGFFLFSLLFFAIALFFSLALSRFYETPLRERNPKN